MQNWNIADLCDPLVIEVDDTDWQGSSDEVWYTVVSLHPRVLIAPAGSPARVWADETSGVEWRSEGEAPIFVHFTDTEIDIQIRREDDASG